MEGILLLWEVQLLDMERVEHYLPDWCWLRTVDKVGAISLGNRNLYVSRQHIKQAVTIRYDLDLHGFVAYEAHDLETPIAIFSHPFVTPKYIMGYDDTDGG